MNKNPPEKNCYIQCKILQSKCNRNFVFHIVNRSSNAFAECVVHARKFLLFIQSTPDCNHLHDQSKCLYI